MSSCERPSNSSASDLVPSIGLEAVVLLDRHPGKLPPLPRQLVVAAGELLLLREQLVAGGLPLLLCPDLVLRHWPEDDGSACLEPPAPPAAIVDRTDGSRQRRAPPQRASRGVARRAARALAPKSTASQIAPAPNHGRAEPSSRARACSPPRPSTRSRAPTARASNCAPRDARLLSDPGAIHELRLGDEGDAEEEAAHRNERRENAHACCVPERAAPGSFRFD